MSKTRNRLRAILAHVERAAFVVAMLMALQPYLLRAAEPYQYIITPGYDPAAASIVDSSSRPSSAAGLATGVASASTASAPLEARFRTWLKSLGTSLRSDKIMGFMLIVR